MPCSQRSLKTDRSATLSRRHVVSLSNGRLRQGRSWGQVELGKAHLTTPERRLWRLPVASPPQSRTWRERRVAGFPSFDVLRDRISCHSSLSSQHPTEQNGCFENAERAEAKAPCTSSHSSCNHNGQRTRKGRATPRLPASRRNSPPACGSLAFASAFI